LLGGLKNSKIAFEAQAARAIHFLRRAARPQKYRASQNLSSISHIL